MDDRTFLRRCLYVAMTVAATALLLGVVFAIGVNIRQICNGGAWLIGKLFHYIAPLIYGFIIAYLLFIPLKAMEKGFCRNGWIAKRNPKRLRLVTILITYILFIALIGVILVSIYMMIGGQISRNTNLREVTAYISDYLAQFEFGEMGITANPTIQSILSYAESWLQSTLESSIANLGTTIGAVSSSLITGLVSVIISIYFLFSYENIVEWMRRTYLQGFGVTGPGKRLYSFVEIFNNTFKQFLKGQLLEACIVAALSVVALKLVGVNYYGVIGVISGICNMIPMVGPWIGAAVAVVVSLLGGNFMTAIWAVVVMLLVQLVDNQLVQPKIVGESVGLHPVTTMIILIVGADINGVVGMLLAVPCAATIKNVIYHIREERVAAAAAAEAERNGDAEVIAEAAVPDDGAGAASAEAEPVS